MSVTESIPVRIWTHGAVPEDSQELAVAKVRLGLRHVVRPVLSARVTLTVSSDPAVPRSAWAQATVDLNGRIVRAEAAGQTMRDAIELMEDRLRAQLDRASQGRLSLRRLARHGKLARHGRSGSLGDGRLTVRVIGARHRPSPWGTVGPGARDFRL